MSTPPDANRACANCPSFLQPEEVRSKFKKSIGSPMCGKYGHVLGRPGLNGMQAEKLQRHFAMKCDSFGEPRPVLPLEKRMLVALPNPSLRVNTEGTPESDAVNSCLSCKNFIREEAVATELGWTAGICGAKGKLVLGGQFASEAKGCEYRAFGAATNTTSGIHLLPEYDEAFQLSADPVKSYFKNKGHVVDPQEYETDKPVSEDDEKSGIRAWRGIPDPNGTGRTAYLPIYRTDFFSPVEQKKIPKSGDDEHPELYVDHFGGAYLAAVVWTEMDETPALWGMPGVGKTELYRYLAWMMALPFERISITASTEVDELIGFTRFGDGETYFEYGRLPLAWQKPCVLCLDEPNVGQPDIWQILRPLTDNSKQLVIDANKGERFERNDDCYFGFAMNPAWDARNVGANPISDADANRLFHVYIELPPASLEREIIRNRVALDGWEISEEQLDMLLNIASDIRDLSEEGTITATWGLRPQIKVARALNWFDVPTAYRRAVGDFLEPKQLEAMLDMVKSHVN